MGKWQISDRSGPTLITELRQLSLFFKPMRKNSEFLYTGLLNGCQALVHGRAHVHLRRLILARTRFEAGVLQFFIAEGI